MNEQKSIYDLKLHESITFNSNVKHVEVTVQVIRVPLGWIYNTFNGAKLSSVFVPLAAPEKNI